MKQRANLLILITAVLMLLSCAKDKPYEEVHKVPELASISGTIDTNATFLYMPSTQGVPKDVGSVDSYMPGIEKMVKLRFTKDSLEVYEIYKDERFRGNDLNNFPVISIPVTYKEFQCAKNSQDECSNREEENTTIDWSKKSFFLPDFASLRIQENNITDFFIDKSCFHETGVKLVDYTMNKEVINIRLEKTFKTALSNRCLDKFKDISATGFKVGMIFSLVKLDKLASKDYEPVDYPDHDRGTFGFFTSTTSTTDIVYDESRIKRKYFLNRFNPKKKEIVYYLSDTFNKSRNKLLKEATYQSFENVNLGLKMADAGFKLVLKEPKKGAIVGDLRYNVINLIDEPLSNGIAGMAPSIKNPLTGEIVNAFVNMYSGGMRQSAQWTYMAMVDLSISSAKKTPSLNSDEKSFDSRDSAKISFSNEGMNDGSYMAKLHKGFKPRPANFGNISSNSNAVVDVARIVNSGRGGSRVPDRVSSRPEAGKEGVTDIEIDEHEEYLRKLAKHNADPIEMISPTAFARYEFKGIRDIKDIVNVDGTLKSWRELSEAQQKEILDLIMPKIYVQTLVHEIGHNLGLRHNFEASADKSNFYSKEEANAIGMENVPTYSSIMDYSASDLNDLSYFAKYDIAALRFGYARKVETTEGEFIKVTGTLSSVSNENNLKSYKYCTDGDVGSSPWCYRHDEGTTLNEIVQFHINNYNDFYKYRNYRNDRDKFSTHGIYGSVRARDRMFKAVRRIFEAVETMDSAILIAGCNDEQREMYPQGCVDIDDRAAATKGISQMFFDILKTPDLTCAIAYAETPDEVTRTMLFRELFGQLGLSRYGFVPKDCFEIGRLTKLIESATDKEMVIVGQVGRLFMGMREVDPRFYKYSSDLAIRGIWHDKIIAMKYLTKRYFGLSSTEKFKVSLIDIQTNVMPLMHYFSHIALKTPLVDPLPFRKEDGTIIETEFEYSLHGPEYLIPEQPNVKTAKYLGLPIYDNIHITKVLLNTMVKSNYTEDVELAPKSKAIAGFFGVYKKNIDEGFSNSDIATTYTMVGAFGALKHNLFAKKLIDSIHDEENLEEIGEAKVRSIYISIKEAAKAKSLALEILNSFSEEQKSAATFNFPTLEKIKIKRDESQEYGQDHFTNLIEDEKVAKAAFIAYKLEVDQFDKVMEYAKLIQASTLLIPENASEFEKKIYKAKIPKQSIDRYLTPVEDENGGQVSNDLRELNKEYRFVLDLLPAL